MHPLCGTTVVSLEQAVAAPYASRQLADLGARVIKVERPDTGDLARAYDATVHGQSSYFVWLNRSKESVALDLKTAAGREVMGRLLADADVFIHNLGPGAARRLGLDPDSLSEHPRLIHCVLSGYGTSGVWAHRKAYDLLVQSESGLVSLTGAPDSVARVGVSVADIAAGMYAYSGILTALLDRQRTGRGTIVEVSLFDALGEWMGSPMYYTMYAGRSPERVGAQHATIAPYGPYPTADGALVVLAIQTRAEWTEFCASVMLDPDLAVRPEFETNSKRCENRTELNEVVSRRFRELGADEAVALLDRFRIANARIKTMHEFIEHPVLESRQRWVEVGTPHGAVRALLPPATIAGVEPRMDPVPALGEHTDAILAELGCAPNIIDEVRASRALTTENGAD